MCNYRKQENKLTTLRVELRVEVNEKQKNNEDEKKILVNALLIKKKKKIFVYPN